MEHEEIYEDIQKEIENWTEEQLKELGSYIEDLLTIKREEAELG